MSTFGERWDQCGQFPLKSSQIDRSAILFSCLVHIGVERQTVPTNKFSKGQICIWPSWNGEELV